MKHPFLLLGFWFLLGAIFSTAGIWAQDPWQSFTNARLVAEENRDGDSFTVEFSRDGKLQRQLVRLYFVDCPESAAAVDADRRRVVEQMRYFGIDAPALVLEAGKQASDFTAQLLSQPFTLHTAFATAPGRSAMPRIYAMITTAGGKDLGAALVEAGWGRNRGVTRTLPDGTPGAEYAIRLGDWEAGAMLGRRGIWAQANAARIAELREQERSEARTLRDFFGGQSGAPVILNTATAEELQSLPGIGHTLAERILARRPFTSIEELTDVRGISSEMLDRLRERLVLEPTP